MDVDLATGFTVQNTLSVLNMTDITCTFPPKTFTSAEKHTHVRLNEAVCNLPTQQQEVLVNAAQCKRRKLSSVLVVDALPFNCADDPFLETISSECCRDHLIKFIDATGKDTMTTFICAVCTGCYFKKEITLVLISDLKAKGTLHPSTAHPAHVLTDGMLLHSCHESMHCNEDRSDCAQVCDSCLNILGQT